MVVDDALAFLAMPAPVPFFFLGAAAVMLGTGAGLGAAVVVVVPVLAAFFVRCSALTVLETARYLLYSVPSSLWMSASMPIMVFFLSSLVAPGDDELFFELRSRFISCRARDGRRRESEPPPQPKEHAGKCSEAVRAWRTSMKGFFFS